MNTRKEKRIICIGIMLVLTTLAAAQTSAKADEPPIAEAGGPYLVDECTSALFNASESYDPDGTALEYRWNFDGNWTDWSLSPLAEFTWRDDYQGIIALEVISDGVTSQDTAEIAVFNTPPFIRSVTGPTDPVIVGEKVVITVDFYDGDPRMEIKSLDTYFSTFDWRDNTTSEYLLGVGEFLFSGTHVYSEPGFYEIYIFLMDDDGGETNEYFYVTVIQPEITTINAGPDGLIPEGSSFISAGSVSSSTSDPLTVTVDYNEGSGIMPLSLNADNTFELNHHYCENGIYTVTVTVLKNEDVCGSDTAMVTVVNVPPHITTLSGPPTDPMRLGVPITILGVFTDPGCLDTHVAVIQWGDTQTTTLNLPVGVNQVSSAHTYANAGVYLITLTVTDDDGDFDTKSIESYVVVYDPNCGFVTGGGWINTPAGSYPADPTLSGKTTFGFVSKYKKGQSTPEGNTEFQFHAGGLNFHSHTYEWLIIAGPKATYKGTGTINGQGNYGFKITAIDGKINGGGGIDKLRMKIWDKDNNNEIVFDNNIGNLDDATPDTALSGGQITIHKA